ncbi:hypothetical protein JHK82_055834 [Glycine max]|nr:hypothetical protein JHK82_055834 [Glycine max]
MLVNVNFLLGLKKCKGNFVYHFHRFYVRYLLGVVFLFCTLNVMFKCSCSFDSFFNCVRG